MKESVWSCSIQKPKQKNPSTGKKLLGEASLSGIKSSQFNKTSKFHYGHSKCFGNTA